MNQTRDLNWLDRTITWLFPRTGARRLAARAAIEVLASYEGAKVGRRTDGWITSGADANAAIGGDLPRLRDRSRDLIRNNAHAARGKSVVTCSTVGTGIVPQADTGDPALDKTINGAFTAWGDECDADGQLDFFGLQRMWVEAIFESGETLVRRRLRRLSDGLYVPLQLQTLESDHLDLYAMANNSGGVTIQGVERDAIGRRSGYWLYPNHPGASAVATMLNTAWQSKFVPASEIAHGYRKTRPGQERGVPWLAPVMRLLRDMDEYAEAEIVRAKIAACPTLFVTQPEDMDGRGVGKATTETATGERIEKMRPGMILYGRPGEDMKPFAPQGHSNFAEFMKFMQHIAATGQDLFYAQISGDLASVNWSSFRAGDRDFRAAIEAFRWLCVIPMLCRPVWRWFIDAAFLAGKIPVPNYGVSWTPPQFMSVNPEADAASDEADLANGTLTWDEAVARRGYDPTKQYEKILGFKQKCDRDGLVFAWDRSKVTASGAKQVEAKQAQRNGGN